MTMIYYHGLYEAYKRSFRVKNDHLTQAGLALGMAGAKLDFLPGYSW